MTNIPQEDVTDQPRSLTVDEILDNQRDAEAEEHMERVLFTGEPTPPPSPDEIIGGAIDNIVAAHDECQADIDRLVQARLDINEQIKVRRDQLNKLHRMQRIIAEPDEQPTLESAQV